MDVSLHPILNYTPTSATLACALLLIFLTFLAKLFYFVPTKSRSAPTAAGGWPIIGHLPILGGSDLPHITLGALADKYGPIFSIRLGVHPAVVVSSSEIAKECFTTNDKAFSSRPNLVASKQLGYNLAMFGLAPHGPYWREVRKIATSELLSNTRLQRLKHVRVSEVEAAIHELHALCSDAPVLVEMKGWLENLTLNVMVRMISGKRYRSREEEEEDEEARRWKTAIRELFRLLGLSVVSDAFPLLEWMDVGGHIKAMKRTAKELDTILGGWLEEHRRRKLSESSNEHDFMDVLLTVLDGRQEFFGHDVDTVVKATSLAMILGGTDTSAVTVTWAISLLLNNPHVSEKVQEELRTQVGYERKVSESDISNLVYLQAVIKEAWRLYPPAPLLAPRECIEGCTVAGYQVPKGTRLIVNAWKLQRDPRIWSDPLSFKPERFMEDCKDVDARGHHFEFIPFGSGRRVCPGISFAYQMTHLMLASFLQAFEISNPSSQPVDMTESFGLTNMKATPLQINVVKPRLPSNVY